MNKQKYFEESLPEEYVLVKHVDAKNINRQAVVYALFFDRGKLHGTQTRDLALFCFHDHPVFLYRLCLLYQRFLRLERFLLRQLRAVQLYPHRLSVCIATKTQTHPIQYHCRGGHARPDLFCHIRTSGLIREFLSKPGVFIVFCPNSAYFCEYTSYIKAIFPFLLYLCGLYIFFR